MFVEGTKFVGGGRENNISVLYACYDRWLPLVHFPRTSCAGCHLVTQLVAALDVMPPLLVGNGW